MPTENQKHAPVCSIRLESRSIDCSPIQLKSVRGVERIGGPFEFVLQLVTTEPDSLTEEALLAAGVTLAFYREETVERRVHGRIHHVEREFDASQQFDVYTVRVGPHLWALSTYTGQEIYLNMTVPEIIVQKLHSSGLTAPGIDYEVRLNATYPKREFVVQYQETDLDFVMRLAEHDGISIVLEHGALGSNGWDPLATNGVDKVVLLDHAARFLPLMPEPNVAFDETGNHTSVYALKRQTSIVPRLFWVRDYNYSMPDHDLYGSDELDMPGSMGANIEFGANVLTDQDAARLAKVRAEEMRAKRERYEGKSDVLAFAPGMTFTLESARHDPQQLLIVEVHHKSDMTVLTSGGEGHELDYENRFVAVDANHTYRPPRLTPKPRIHGIMTGEVRTLTHDKGDTVPDPPISAIDALGRYHVELHLDTPGRDASHQGGTEGVLQGVLSSLPIRMLQPSAGRDYGIHMPLRAGTEVAVAFIGGDPDRPVIVGAVPNAVTPNVVAGGKEAKLSRIKTQTGVLIQFGD